MKEIFIRSQDSLNKIELDNVYFFTKRDSKVIAIFKNNYLILDISLYALYELISKNQNFFRAHKSFIVNINKIDKITRFGSNTYNVKFMDIKDQAYITQKNLSILKERIIII